MKKILLSSLALVVCAGAIAAASGSGSSVVRGSSSDWHQWGGPNRNFHADTKGLAVSWPADGPKRLWERELGEGYSSIVAFSGALFTMYRSNDDEDEVIVSLDANTGATRWEHRYLAPLYEDMDYGTWLRQGGAGPHSTPLLLDDTLFAVGVTGKFFAFNPANGDVRWSLNLDEEFDMSGYRGFAPSPIAYGDNVILPIGGRGQAIVAFDRKSGNVAWKNQDFRMAPASPILIDVDGQDQLVVFTPEAVVGLDPSDGSSLWSHPHETNYGLNISTPVWGEGNLLFVSSAYNGGSRVIELVRERENGRTTPRELWYSNRFRLHFGNAIRIGDLVFGTSGDFGPAFFAAVDVHTGREVWRERTFARSQMVYADDKLVIVDESGDLAVASASSEGLTVHARVELLTENAWTPPTLVDTKLYVRDRKNIVAVDLGN
jgi:outer membrane protein assembly factor BamB